VTPIANTKTGAMLERIVPAGALSKDEHRWIGRCKKCGKTHKVEGRVMQGYRADRGGGEYVIQANDGQVYVAEHPHDVVVMCGDHWCRLKRVTEGTKQSKHECGARCMSSTGPNCDCRCKGKNHGSNC
jgi:hypothetical protein